MTDISPRRRHGRIPILLAFLTLLAAESGSGQGVGTSFFLDYQFGVPTDVERTAGEISYCTACDGTGTSQSHTARIGVRINLPEHTLFGLPTYLGSSLHYATGAFRSNPYVVSRPVDTGVVTTGEEFTLRTLTAGLGVEAGVELPLGRVRGSAGIWGDLRLTGYLVQQEEILSPSGATYGGAGTTRRIVREGEDLSDEPIGYGLQVGLGMPIDVGGRLRLLPSFGARLDLPGLFDGIGVRSLSGLFRLGVDIESPPEPPGPPAPPEAITLTPPPPPPTPLPFTVSLTLHAESGGARQDTARIVLLRELRRRHEGGTITEEIVERYEAPEIRVVPTMRSPEGIAWWGLTFRRAHREVARVTSDDPRGVLDLDLTPRGGGDPAAPLHGELVVEDSTGRVSAARATLPVAIDSSIAGRPGAYSRVIDVWENIPESIEEFVEDLESTLKGRDVVSITITCGTDDPLCSRGKEWREMLAARYSRPVELRSGGEGVEGELRVVSE